LKIFPLEPSPSSLKVIRYLPIYDILVAVPVVDITGLRRAPDTLALLVRFPITTILSRYRSLCPLIIMFFLSIYFDINII
jgi:hypothetical protein